MKARIVRSKVQKGQSTTEFMLMVPVIFGVFFFVIEMGLYFTAIHYTNYATYVTARSRMANYGFQPKGPTVNFAPQIASLVLTGSVYKNNFNATQTSGGVKIALKHWQTNFPFLSVLMPNAPFALNVHLGAAEYLYEQNAGGGCSDNNVSSNPC